MAGVVSSLAIGCGSTPQTPSDLSDDAPVADLASPDSDSGARRDGGPEPDLAATRCNNTPDDCGPNGACVNCLGSSIGHLCVNTKCGCATSMDCDQGKVCIAGSCSIQGCDAMNLCNGGCCDHGACIMGSDNAKCGGNGAACVPCGGGAPTCQNGACTAACVAGKPGGPGVCGMGFCCGQNDQCQAVGDGACGAIGAICVDCSQSVAGSKCLPGNACGCTSAADCQKGQACKAGVCGAACDANAPCNGGCCANGKCVDGSVGAACALGGALCGSCAGNAKGGACVTLNNMTFCGCDSQVDCPPNFACDPVAKTCTSKCDMNSPCNGGCCGNGVCTVGSATHSCGSNGGACLDCAGNANGFACVPTAGGGHCGCSDLSQCPMSVVACDMNAKICNHVCSANLKCQTGCCTDANAGTCVNGAAASACGASGVCVNCTVLATGLACRANQLCGCDSAADCPPGQACNTLTHSCVTKCGMNQPCNSACCSNGTCAPGSDGKACGSSGACVDCSLNKVGHACLGGTACGCSSAADCGSLQACDAVNKVCTNACDQNQACNGGCCANGLCVDGGANSACGAGGLACAVCGGTLPTCDAGKCTSKCGQFGNGQCDGGSCCKAGTCTAGTTSTSCGFSGTCVDCSASPSGVKCVQKDGGPYFCGCEAKSDCHSADAMSNTPGQSCDTAMKSCSSHCGANGLSGCNGGCCSGANGLCRPGNQDSSCGVSGGFCSNCLSSCNPGPTCNVQTGACGCTDITDCFFTPQCQFGGAQREACSLPRGACCIPSWFNGTQWEDNGNPANCCTGMSVNGVCTCVPTGQPSMNDAANCCSQHAQNGTCSCLPNGANCLAESDSNGECCSGQCLDTGVFDFHCVPSQKGKPCQSDLGCAGQLKCINGVCG